MSELIGKRLKYKGSNEIKTVKDVKEGKVYFTDNGVTQLSSVSQNWDEINNNVVNPDTFFNPDITMRSNLGSLVNDVQNLFNNPNGYNQNNYSNYQHEQPLPTISRDGQDLGQNYDYLSPETKEQIRRQMEEDKRNLQMKENLKKNDPWMNQFKGGSVTKIDADAYKQQLEEVSRINVNKESINPDEFYNQGNNQNKINDNKSNGLPKMKKSFKIKLNLELNEMIPKIEDIRAVENLFDINLTDELAKEIANKYLNDRELFEGMIISELEKIIKPKKKPLKKKTSKKRIVKSKLEISKLNA